MRQRHRCGCRHVRESPVFFGTPVPSFGLRCGDAALLLTLLACNKLPKFSVGVGGTHQTKLLGARIVDKSKGVAVQRWGMALRVILFVLLAADVAQAETTQQRNERLIAAASSGDIAGVRALIAQGANVNYASHPFKDAATVTSLGSAAQAGHADVMALLLKSRANPNVADHHGVTPLNWATFYNKAAVVQVLLDGGADPNIAEASNSVDAGMAPLHQAARLGSTNIVGMLLKHGARVNHLTAEKATALDLAEGALTAELLVKHGARIGGFTEGGELRLSPLDSDLFTSIASGNERLVRAVLERGAHADIHNSVHQTPLIRAVALRRLAIVSALLDNGASVNLTDEFLSHDSPLHWATARGDRQVIQLLLGRGAVVNAQNRMKQAPLDYATDHEVAEILLRSGADANGTLVRLFCHHLGTSNVQFVKALLTHGGNPNPGDGCSPLLQAEVFSYWEVAQLLLDHGADPNVANKDGHRPLTMAAGAAAPPDLIRTLLTRGAQVDAADSDGALPLVEAARYGRTETVALLLDHKADSRRKGKSGTTALGEARNLDVIDMLVQRGAAVSDVWPAWFGAWQPTAQQQVLFRLVLSNDNAGVRALTETQRDERDPTTQGNLLLNLAATFGRDEMLDWLLGQGMGANTADINGTAPIHRATRMATRDTSRQLRVMSSLVNHGADVNATNHDGWAPLHLAAGSHNATTVEWLLRHGANPSIKTNGGQTALEIAGSSSSGTSALGLMTQQDVGMKQETIELLRK